MLIKVERLRDVSDIKYRQINGTKIKENFLFNINDSILKKFSISKSIFSAKIQCSNLTLALKPYHSVHNRGAIVHAEEAIIPPPPQKNRSFSSIYNYYSATFNGVKIICKKKFSDCFFSLPFG